MLRIRKLSPTEKFYMACESLFPPFAIQFLLRSERLPSCTELENAMRKVADANPTIRLKAQSRWWVDTQQIPGLRLYQYEGELLEAPLLKEKIASKGPACELVIWKNKGLLFRASHALMDAGGLLFWAEEIFRALRGETLLGSFFIESDHEFLKSLKHPASRKPLRYNCQAKLTLPKTMDAGFSWSQQTIPGQQPAYLAKLAQKLAAATASDRPPISRFMIPVDLRRLFPSIRTTMNFSNPLIIELQGTEEWEQVYQSILEGINNKSYQAMDWKDKWITSLPNGLLKGIVKYLHTRSIKKNNFALSGILSHVGTIPLSRFSAKNFIPSAAYFMPLDTPGTARTIVSLQHDHALELSQSIVKPVKPLAHHSEPSEGAPKIDVNHSSSQDWLCFPGEEKMWETEKGNINEMLAEQAKNHPELIAATYLDESWSYRVLMEKATLVHLALSELKLGPGDVVAIFYARSLKLLATILGVLQSGAAFLPIDTAWPLERQQFILEDAKARALITDLENSHKIEHPLKIVWEHLKSGTTSPASVQGSIAYVLYTSGSTGLPKGIKVGHASLRNYILWARDVYQQVKEEALCFPLFTSVVFDLTLTSIFLPWLTKGQVKIISHKTLMEQAYEILQDKAINSIKLTPSHLSVFNELGFEKSSIQRLILGGEALGTSLVNTSLAQKKTLTIFNEYGPTEATIGCMYHLFNPRQDKENWVPIGKPIANCTILLKPGHSSSSPQEIYLAGACLALGYLGKAAKERQNFLPHPLKIKESIYRTGDLVSVNQRAELVYQGRLDNQLKIRGHRIELGEIEACIHASGLIKANAVIVADTLKKPLIAYVVWQKQVAVNELWSFLRAKLPVYMLPEQLLTLDQLPLTINGKVDKIFLAKHFNENLVESYQPEFNDSAYTQELLDLLVAILGDKSIKIDRQVSLLEQGVDSLSLSIFLMRVLNHYFGNKMSFELFFSETDFIKNPTLAALEKMIVEDLA